uniref:VOC domain-containing protein n=1 Tax=Arion vulgaris TaxID=1028688 RepID=A0A0B7AFW7_9EUPU
MEEDEDNGLVLATNDVGLRLRAMEYWKCSEVNLIAPEDENIESRLSMVIAEGLPPVPGSSEKNQIESWISQHGGPGIQHVALVSSNIKVAIKNLRQLGTPFANAPPATYYSKMGRLDDIILAGEDVDALRDNGILIDTESDGIHYSNKYIEDFSNRQRYLLQIFTRPVFRRDPFFLEIIQRTGGATGFGSGNIAALYRSVQAYIVGEKSLVEN